MMDVVANTEIFEVVKKHLVDTVDTIDPNTVNREDSMKDLGASSMDIVEVVSCSMRELRVRVPRQELSELSNIGQLVDMLEQSIKAKAAGEAQSN